MIRKIISIPPIKIIRRFINDMIPGYRIYKQIIKEFGSDVTILAAAWYGTGDYYLCGCYIEAWIEEYKKTNFVFLAPEKSAELKVLRLFPILEGHIKVLTPKLNYSCLKKMCIFSGNTRFIDLHHQRRFLDTDGLNWSDGQMEGFRNLNMVDFYLASGFKLNEGAIKRLPIFNPNEVEIKKIFKENNLEIGRTVLIAPYSTGLNKMLIPQNVWETITLALQKNGYCVCTNCFGNEIPIKGTKGIGISYRDIVPFLNMAGVFIGIRSGLCDIISSSSSKKIILHTYEAKWWPNGNSIPYTGLNLMGLCNDAFEMEYREGQENYIVEEVIKYI